MKRKLILLLIAVATTTIMNAQNLSSFGGVSLSPSALSFKYQTPISDSWVLDSKLGVSAGINASAGSYSLILSRPAAFASTEARYLYSFKKRVEMGRDIKLNSASYWGIKAKYQADAFNNKTNETYGNALGLSAVWGLQRNLDSNFLFDFNIGVNWTQDFNMKSSGFFPEIGLGISYIFIK